MLARAGWRAALEAPPERMLALVAEASTQLMSRAARLLAVGEAAAKTTRSWPSFESVVTPPLARTSSRWQRRSSAQASYAKESRPNTPPISCTRWRRASPCICDSSSNAAGATAPTRECSSRRSPTRSPAKQHESSQTHHGFASGSERREKHAHRPARLLLWPGEAEELTTRIDDGPADRL